MKLRNASLQVYEVKTLSHILLHVFCLHFLMMYPNYFFQIGFESVWAQFLSGYIRGKYCYLQFTCSITIHLTSQVSSCWIWYLTFSRVRFLSNKLKFFVSCNIKITRTSFFLLYVLICTFLYKNLVVLLHGDNNFLFWHLYSHFQQLSQRWRNDNLSLDVCYNFVLIKNITSSMFNFFLIKISCLREKKNNRETLEKHVSWKNHSVIAKYLGY